MMAFLKACWKSVVSVTAPPMAEPMEDGSILVGSEKVRMMAETADFEIQPRCLRRFKQWQNVGG
jgi:hypothetical protein